MRAAALTTIALAACVPSVAQVEAPVRATLRTRLGAEPTADDAAVRTALAQPLTRASVTRIALARNARVAAALAEVGIAAGDAAAARGIGRTQLALSAYLASSGDLLGGHADVVHDVTALILAAPRRRAGEATLSAAPARATAEVLAVAARADGAFLAVAAATAELALARTVFDAAEAAADLTGRVHAAGGTTDLALAREQSLREEARLAVARTEAAVEVARAELDAALGLAGDDTRWTLGEGVPELPATPPALDDLEGTAVATSLELAALRADALAAANRARAAKVGAWLPELSAGVGVEYHDGEYYPGPALHVGLPLGSGERGRAAAEVAAERRVAHRTTAAAVELRALARAARMRALAAYEEARHLRDVLVPLRRRVLDETVLQYNAMNASPFELLLARRELAAAERELVGARHRFAAAMTTVDALRRGATVGVTATAAAAAPARAPEPHRGGH